MVSGRAKEGYFFQETASYFQSTAFAAYTSEEAFSIALWVKPCSIYGNILIRLSTNSNSRDTACFDLLQFITASILIANLY